MPISGFNLNPMNQHSGLNWVSVISNISQGDEKHREEGEILQLNIWSESQTASGSQMVL